MMYTVLSVLLLVCLASADVLRFQQTLEAEPVAEPGDSKTWVLLVAGSSGWDNYRHQADVCHAYQIVHKHGIPDDQIVVMMYDDIASHKSNPLPGKIINQPNGTDVYGGVLKDYTGKIVTPKNFLNILQGNATAMKGIGSGKVINSGPNDRIFVYFADHGAPGIVAFPAGQLSATKWNTAIQAMHNANKYSKMVIYVEACESGSMFNKLLPNNINVYVTTAANPSESSYGCYCNYKNFPCLGDTYSVKWLQDSDVEDLSQETLAKQFTIVKNETKKSHVMEYGDLTMNTLKVGQFQGNTQAKSNTPKPADFDDTEVRSEDTTLVNLQFRLAKATDVKEQDDLVTQMKEITEMRVKIKTTFRTIVALSSKDMEQASRIQNERLSLENFNCYEPTVTQVDDLCYDLSQYDYALRQLYQLVNLCEEGVALDTILGAVHTACAL